MQTRATADGSTGTTGGVTRSDRAAASPGSRTRLQRAVARLKGDYEEDGTNRPVRLPLWIDLSAALLIILFVVACWVVFFGWLARTQG